MSEKSRPLPKLPDPQETARLKGPIMNAKPSHSLELHAITHGGLLNRADLALKIGELLALNVYDEASIARQRPLNIRDDGDHWTILGSHNGALKEGDTGPLKVVLRKWDGQVLELAIPMFMEISEKVPEQVRARIRDNRKRWCGPTKSGEKP